VGYRISHLTFRSRRRLIGSIKLCSHPLSRQILRQCTHELLDGPGLLLASSLVKRAWRACVEKGCLAADSPLFHNLLSLYETAGGVPSLKRQSRLLVCSSICFAEKYVRFSGQLPRFYDHHTCSLSTKTCICVDGRENVPWAASPPQTGRNPIVYWGVDKYICSALFAGGAGVSPDFPSLLMLEMTFSVDR